MRKRRVSVNPLEIDRRLKAILAVLEAMDPAKSPRSAARREHVGACAIAVGILWEQVLRDFPPAVVENIRAAVAQHYETVAPLAQKEAAGG